MPVDINAVQFGQKLIAIEVLSGRKRALVGSVAMIDRERQEIVIRVGGAYRSFPPKVLGYDPRDQKPTTSKS